LTKTLEAAQKDSHGTWTAGTAYAQYATVVPTVPNGRHYICTVAGTTHATVEPTWPTTSGDTVTDGTATWGDNGKRGDAKLKLALTKSGQATKTYYIDSGTDRIVGCKHIEQEWSQYAQVSVQDSSGTLAALSLHGYLGIISNGFNTALGDEYSACAPLEVVAQGTTSSQGSIVTSFSLAGAFDMMGEDHASEDYIPEDTNGDTVKIILTAIANKTMDCFSHCKSFAITYDTGYDAGSDLTNTVIPADAFSVHAGETRLSAFKKALRFCGCKARVENDSGVATIHIFIHESTTPEYVYNDTIAADNHNFFDKSVRKRIVIPSYQEVKSHPSHIPQYSGATGDTGSYNALGRYIYGAPFYIRATSDAQCAAISLAMITNAVLASEKGHGFAPMNCVQEVLDYVNIVDSRVGDERDGNVGYISRDYSQGSWTIEFRFGNPSQGGIARPALIGDGAVSYEDLSKIYDYINDMIAYLWGEWLDLRYVIPWLVVEKYLGIPTRIPFAPKVTTEDATSVGSTTATLNGTVTSLGVPNPTAHRFCYNTTGDPTTDDTTTDEGTPTAEGAYTSDITGLTAETTYFFRAYVTNTRGTGYGIQVRFTTTA